MTVAHTIIIDRESITTLPIEDGEVLVVRVPDHVNPTLLLQRLADQFTDLLEYLELENCTVIAIQKSVELELLNEEQMAAVGWVRKEEF